MRCKICGSMAINPHMHGRDNADLDLCDVCYWRKRANGAKPTLSEVLAKVEKRAFWDYVPGRAIRIEDLEDVLSEYFD